MKTQLIGLGLLGLTSMVYAQKGGVNFEKTLNLKQIRNKAKTEKKLIFMDVYATWCGPCTAMDTKVYPSEQLGTLMNNKFISVKVQVDTTKNDDADTKKWYQDAHLIKTQYKVNSYPTLLCFSTDGKLINKAIGYKDEKAFIRFIENSLDPERQFYTVLEHYKLGKLEYQKMPELARYAKSLGEMQTAREISNDYIDNYLLKKPDNELFLQENLELIGEFMGDTDSESFVFFWKQQDKINAVLGDYQAENKIMNCINTTYLPQDISSSKAADWLALEDTVIRKFGALGKEIISGQRMIYHFLTANDWQSYGEYFKQYYMLSLKHPRRYYMNDMSWAVFQHVKDLDILKFALDVMKYDLETYDQDSFQAYDTYANLLYKTGRNKEAIEWEEKALKRAKGSPDDFKTFADLLTKMKKGEPTW